MAQGNPADENLRFVKLYLDDEDPVVRLNALRAIYALRKDNELDAVVARVDDTDATVLAQAVQIAGHEHTPQLMTALARVAQTDSLNQVRLFALHWLTRYKQAEVIPVYITALDDSSYAVRKNALEQLKLLVRNDLKFTEDDLTGSGSAVRSAWHAWYQKHVGKSLGQIAADENNVSFPTKTEPTNTDKARKAIALANEKTPQSRAKLEMLLKETTDTAFKTTIIQAIGESRDKAMLPIIEKLYTEEKDVAVKQKLKETRGKLEANKWQQ